MGGHRDHVAPVEHTSPCCVFPILCDPDDRLRYICVDRNGPGDGELEFRIGARLRRRGCYKNDEDSQRRERREGSTYLVRGYDAQLVLADRFVAAVWGASWPHNEPMGEFLTANGIRTATTLLFV